MKQYAHGAPSSLLRVAMPMMNFVPGGMGGSETYVRELSGELRRLENLDVRRFVPRGAQEVLPVGDAMTEIVSSRVRVGGSGASRAKAIGRAAASRSLARETERNADVIHYPFTIPVPRPRSTPFVVTLLDVQHLDRPEFLPFVDRAFRRWAYDRSAKQADAVITISEFCRSRIVHHLDIDPARVNVIPLAVSSTFRESTDRRQDFVIYPAKLWAHKNHDRLIKAMEVVRRSRPRMKLILTGGNAGLSGAPSWVEQRGLVSEAELARLYRRASCMAFPSLYEGFGLPVLEAMASGCPVACSTAGALPELCSDAAVMFDPNDVEGMASAIGEAVDDGDRLRSLGLERSRRFSWNACAKSHVNVYQNVVASALVASTTPDARDPRRS